MSEINLDPAIRSLDIRTDLGEVANLIEICFSSQMDADGWSYLNAIRKASRNRRYIRWIPGAGERVSYPLFGYVWEENGRVVGNLSLIPLFKNLEWRYLIANVAVHPDHRRKGIARQLTYAAIQHAKRQGAASAWLQVRSDNPPARLLYQSLGFVERAERTSWLRKKTRPPVTALNPAVKITPRSDEDWQHQLAWLEETYPSAVSWNLPIHTERYAPTLKSKLIHLIEGQAVRHWTAWFQDKPVAAATWEPTTLHADNLWVGADPEMEDMAIRNLLPRVQQDLDTGRPLMVNYPGGQAETAFQQAGFSHLNTLVWMEKRLDSV